MGDESPVGQDVGELLFRDVGLDVDLGRVVEDDALGEDVGFALAEGADAEDGDGVADGVGEEGDEDDADDDGEDSLELVVG